MIIQCAANTGVDLPAECLLPEGGFSRETEFELVIGKRYVVYAATMFLLCPWFYICDELFRYYPIWHPSPLFSIIDGRLSRYWKCGIHRSFTEPLHPLVIAFPEWVDDEGYYERLADGNDDAKALFAHYKDLIDKECGSQTSETETQ